MMALVMNSNLGLPEWVERRSSLRYTVSKLGY